MKHKDKSECDMLVTSAMDLEQRAEEHFQRLGAIPQTGGRLGDTTHTDDKDKDGGVENAAKRIGSARLRVASVVLADFQDPVQKRAAWQANNTLVPQQAFAAYYKSIMVDVGPKDSMSAPRSRPHAEHWR